LCLEVFHALPEIHITSDLLEFDPHHLLDYDEEEDLEMEIEEEEPEEEPAEGADVELKAEEPDGVLEAAIGAGSQRPFAILLEGEENATLRKKLTEKEVLLDLTHMERDRAEK
nr:hypothetical protein [Tanacetum cinerariifolium]